jgi:hypothetical protein
MLKLVVILTAKHTENIIGLKEDITMRLEDVVGIERVEVLEEYD